MREQNKIDDSVEDMNGCKEPDEAYICMKLKLIFIIEKKFQQCSGSACEKLQTGGLKQYHYSRKFPEFKVIYIFCLSDWFKEHCKQELNYIDSLFPNVHLAF